ncbi:Phosphate regulon sensor protein phoR [Suttonella ornithocola]|uniref:histidine kinase n=1 Tax=Suttonella ornithocola TaxID=279832 RepID=A0A380MPF2_9GAMM|nr:Phosphate regulon sensor protein phoR [Suttonella ornithocola]
MRPVGWIVIFAAGVADFLFSLRGKLIGLAFLGFIGITYYQQKRLLNWSQGTMKTLPEHLSPQLTVIAYRMLRQKEQGKRRKKRLQRFLVAYRELVEAMPDIALLTNEDGYLLGFNRRAQETLALSKRLDIGRRIDHLIRVEGIDVFSQAFQQDKPLVVRLLSQENLQLEFLRVPLAQGNILYLARDVTARLDLDARRKAFIDNASHELKTPLTVIMGFSEVLKVQTNLPEQWAMPLAEIHQAAEQMQELVADMLQLATLENLETTLKRSPLCLTAVINSWVEELNQAYPAHIGIVINRVEEIMLWADEKVLHSMVSNLLQNAILHSGSRQPISVTVSVQPQDNVNIIIQDTGIGIDPQHIH